MYLILVSLLYTSAFVYTTRTIIKTNGLLCSGISALPPRRLDWYMLPLQLVDKVKARRRPSMNKVPRTGLRLPRPEKWIGR
jgi:hypothetical protein